MTLEINYQTNTITGLDALSFSASTSGNGLFSSVISNSLNITGGNANFAVTPTVSGSNNVWHSGNLNPANFATSGSIPTSASFLSNYDNRYVNVSGDIMTGTLSTQDLTSTKYFLGTDLSIVPIVGNQSGIGTWWGLQLVGNRQSDITLWNPTPYLNNDSYGVILSSDLAPTTATIGIYGIAGQVTDLVKFVNNKANGQVVGSINITGGITFNSITSTGISGTNGNLVTHDAVGRLLDSGILASSILTSPFIASLTGSLQTQITANTNTNNSQQTTLSQLTSVTGSFATIVNVAAISAGLNSRLIDVQTVNGLQSTAIQSLSATNLTVTPIIRGGTNNFQYTPGGVVVMSGSAMATDADNFYWDTVNKRLSIGSNNAGTNRLYVEGNLAVSCSGSSTANPRRGAFSNLDTGNACRFMFGDDNNAFQNSYGGRLQLYSYWGIDLLGSRQSISPPSFTVGQTTDAGVYVLSPGIDRQAMVIQGVSGQNANIFEIQDNSSNTIFSANVNGLLATETITVSSSLGNITGADLLCYGTINPIPKISELKDDFISATAVGNLGWALVNSGTGAASSISTAFLLTATDKPFGVVRLVTGTTATGRSNINLGTDVFMFGYGDLHQRWRVALDILSTVTERYITRIGFIDSNTNVEPTDGAYFEYDEGTAGNFWRICTSNNSVRTKVTTTVATQITSFNNLWIVIPANASKADFYINDILVGSINTNIPTVSGRTVGIGATIVKTVGTTSRSLWIDYFSNKYLANR